MIGRNSGVLVYHKLDFPDRSNLFSFVYNQFPVSEMNAQTRDDLNAFGSPVFSIKAAANMQTLMI